MTAATRGPGARAAAAAAAALPAVRRRGRARRLLRALRHQAARASATTSASSRCRGWPASATAASGTRATRTRWRCSPATRGPGRARRPRRRLQHRRLPPRLAGRGQGRARRAADPAARRHGHRREPQRRRRPGLRRRRSRPRRTRSWRSPPRARPSRRRRRTSSGCSRATRLSRRQHRRLARLLAARRAGPASSCRSTTRSPRPRSPRAWTARPPRRARRATRSRAGSASTPPTSCPHLTELPSHRPRLGAGVLRRPVELRLRARRRSPSRSRRPARPTRWRWRSRWSAFANAAGGMRQHHRRARPGRAGAARRPGRMPANAPTEGDRPMAEFTASVYQNEFLPDGGTDVNAIVTVDLHRRRHRSAAGAGGTAGEVIIVDTSGSMGPATMAAAAPGRDDRGRRDRRRRLVRRHRRLRPRDARLPAGLLGPGHGPGRTTETRTEAQQAIARFVGSGGTAMSTWLDLAGQLFGSIEGLTQRHAILLTDGENREDQGKLDARHPPGHRLLPVRLPRRRHRLAGRGAAPHRPGPARHRRHHPLARPDGRAVPAR